MELIKDAPSSPIDPQSLPAGGAPSFGRVSMGVLAWATIFGRRSRRETEFVVGPFVFRQLSSESASVRMFVENYIDELWHIYRENVPALAASDRSQMTTLLLSQERAMQEGGDRQHYFCVYQDGTPVAGVAVGLVQRSRRRSDDPTDRQIADRLRSLARVGRIMYTRKIFVAAQLRRDHRLMQGLLKCVNELALENDISFIINLSYPWVLPMYAKMGFKAVMRLPDELGIPVQLMILNFAEQMRLVMRGRAPTHVANSVIGSVNPYLLKRWFARFILAQGWRPRSFQAWSPAVMKRCMVGVPSMPG